jgi:hypothetical protein
MGFPPVDNMSEEYIKQLEEENAALKSKIETMFEWVEVTPYRNEYIRLDQKFFMVEMECYINGLLFAMVGKNTASGKDSYRGVCKGTSVMDTKLEVVKKSIENTYKQNFYQKVRI